MSAVLSRASAVPALVGEPADFLIIAGLAGTARDIASLCEPNANYFACAGVMGAATTMGLGLALAQPARRVLVVTGDGELLMNLGSLATVAVMRPSNLRIICVDNGLYAETGGQLSHTAHGVDVAGMATAAGIPNVFTVRNPSDLQHSADLLRKAGSTSFIRLIVDSSPSPAIRRSLNAAGERHRFKLALATGEPRRGTTDPTV